MNKVFEKYRKMTLPVKAAFWFTISAFLQKGISMLTTPIFTRILTTEQYGTVSTFTAWQSALLIVVTLSLEKSIMNLYVKSAVSKEKILSSVMGLSLLLSIVWFIVYLFFHSYISKILGISEILVFCMFISFMVTPAISCWSIYKRYTYDYKSLVKVTFFLTFLTAILSVITVLIYEHKPEAKVLSGVFVSALIALPLYIKWFRKYGYFYNKEIWYFSFTFCLALLPHYLSEIILSQSDRIMIDKMSGASEVAIYSVAYSVASLAWIFMNAINSSFAPFQYQKIRSKEYKLLSEVANKVLVFIAILLGLIMLFGSEIVLIFGGKKYTDSVYLIPALCLGIYFNYTFQLFARAQEFFEKKRNIVIASIGCAILNILLNYLCIPIWGYPAAAYTTVISYLVFCLVHYYFYLKLSDQYLGGLKIYNIKTIMIISVGLILIAIIAYISYDLPLLKLLILVGLTIFIVVNRNTLIRCLKDLKRLKK